MNNPETQEKLSTDWEATMQEGPLQGGPLGGSSCWRVLFLLEGDPRCTTFVGAALVPIASGDVAQTRITAEDCSCSASLASQLSCPARLSRSVAAHFRLHRNRSPRRPGICAFFRQPAHPDTHTIGLPEVGEATPGTTIDLGEFPHVFFFFSKDSSPEKPHERH